MEKLLTIINNNKKAFIIGLIALILVVLGVIFIPKVFMNKLNEEEKLTQSLEILGRKYYEDYYYVSAANSDDLQDKADFLSNYSEIGLKISLENILRYNETLEDKDTTEYKNRKKKQDCDKSKSMVTIYPKKDYGAKDYDIKVTLVCGFDK